MASVVDAFKVLGDLSGDAAFTERLRARVEKIIGDRGASSDAALAETYLEAEHELLARPSMTETRESIRKRMREAIAGVEDVHQGFRLLLLDPLPQVLALASALLIAYADRSRLFFGDRLTEHLAAHALAETPWKTVKVDFSHGIAFDAMRMRSVAECGEIVSTLFERWYSAAGIELGDAALSRLFELAYRDVEQTFGFLPAMKNVLGLTPRGVLWAEKVKRLHELEGETVSQAQGLRTADEDLRRQAERLQQTVTELERTRLQLEAVGKARSEFIDIVSHQFRTPLSAIRWNGEMLTDALEEKKIDADYTDPIGTVRQSSVYLIETMNRVFTVLDIETGKLTLDRKPGFLWEVVQDTHDLFAKELSRHKLKWKFERTKDQLKEVSFDKAKVGTVLSVLIGNALSYSADGGHVSVAFSETTVKGKTYQVCTISDNGIGIAKEDIGRLFEKFFRSKPAVLKAPDGTGLGMFIVKNIVEAHDGFVNIESDGEGKGTTVYFGLPLGV